MENKKQGNSLAEMLSQNAGAILMIVVAIAAFGLAFSQYSQNLQEREFTVNGIRIFAQGNSVKNALAGILSPQVIATQVVLENEQDSRPCKVPMQTEAIYGLAASGKNVSFQLLVRDAGYCLQNAGGNSSTRVECVKPQLVVESGECNCVRLSAKNQTVLISGDENWLCANGPNVREVIRWTLNNQ